MEANSHSKQAKSGRGLVLSDMNLLVHGGTIALQKGAILSDGQHKNLDPITCVRVPTEQ